jgi:acyl-CoA thioesterase
MDDEDFDGASAVTACGEGRWRARIPAGWRQGAGAYGGLGCAILLRAMAGAAGGRPPRSLSAQFCAPVPEGEHDVLVTVERRGSSMSFASARMLASERVVLHAVATFGADRSDRLDLEAPRLPDDLPPARDLPAAEAPSPPFPEFLQQYDLRITAGALPHGGEGAERISGWIRPRRPVPLSPWLAVALLDAFPPVALTRAAKPSRGGASPRPTRMASVALHAQLLAELPDPAYDPADHAFVEVRSAATLRGYSDQSARLHGPDGRLLAVVSQLFAVL